VENKSYYENQTQTINTLCEKCSLLRLKHVVEFLKELNILLVYKDKEHDQQRRMANPEDKERVRV
jgi:hypothetical protein